MLLINVIGLSNSMGFLTKKINDGGKTLLMKK